MNKEKNILSKRASRLFFVTGMATLIQTAGAAAYIYRCIKDPVTYDTETAMLGAEAAALCLLLTVAGTLVFDMLEKKYGEKIKGKR